MRRSITVRSIAAGVLLCLAAGSRADAQTIVYGTLAASLDNGSLAGTMFSVVYSYDADQVSDTGESYVTLNSFDFTLLGVPFTRGDIFQGGQVIFLDGVPENVTASFQIRLPPNSPVNNITFGFGNPLGIAYVDLDNQFGGGSFTFDQFSIEARHAFTGAPNDGANPYALLPGTDGNFYGMTVEGGTFNQGAIFQMTPDRTVTVLHSFSGYPADGAYPYRTLFQASDGNFYGSTQSGGSAGVGTVFRMTSDGTVTILHSFTGGADGRSPAALIQATDGNFYGTTLDRGDGGGGTVFMMTLTGDVTVLHAFFGVDGSGPYSLIQASDGNLYGTADSGGSFGPGVIFQLTLDGTFAVLHEFNGTDGGGPYSLIQASDGNFYGTTTQTGTLDLGTIFKMTPDGTVTVLHSFSGGTGGYTPAAPLLEALDGNFYGTTQRGGSGRGMLYRMSPDGTFAVVWAFTGGLDGATPSTAALVQTSDGALYGTAVEGGSTGLGVTFRLRQWGSGDVPARDEQYRLQRLSDSTVLAKYRR